MIVLLGYLASALLAYSLIVTNAIKFRWLNILGCFAFITYGAVIAAFPVLLANCILLCINIYQLVKLYQSKEIFKLITVTTNNKIVEHFIDFYKVDIKKYFPNGDLEIKENMFAFVVLRDLVIANIFIANLDQNGNAFVEINYTIPHYRDFKIGKFLFTKEKNHLIEQGVKKVIYHKPLEKNHEQFIVKMGFVQELINNENCYVKSLV